MRRTLLISMLSLLVCLAWGQSYNYRYWIDNNVGSAVSGSATGEKEFNVNISSLSCGIHAIRVQARNSDGAWSGVRTRYFMKDYEKVSAASGRYWIDDDMTTMHSGLATSGIMEIDISNLEKGIHAVHYQFIATDGTPSGARTKYFMIDYDKVSAASGRYWIDDDMTTMHSGLATSGIIELDISNLEKGIHAVHYQFIATDGTPSGARTRYFFVDRVDRGNFYASVRIDDGNVTVSKLTGKDIVLDIGELEAGEHTLHVSLNDDKGNFYGLSESTFTVYKAAEQTLALESLPQMTYGDNAYSLPTKTEEGLALTWTSNDEAVAKVTGNQLTVIGVGTTTITATQAGNESYLPVSRDFDLTVSKAPLKITAKSYTIMQGEPLPAFAVDYSGFKNGETSSVLTTQPTISNTATSSSQNGTYPITVCCAEAKNYNITYENGTLTITDNSILAGNITFADESVKALCVANWDTNGDGELSMEEATAVTDLGTVFKENKNIESFNELQYFTGLTAIGEYAFYYCKQLTSVIIPNSVTSIGNYAFLDCSGLTSVTIPNSVTSLGNFAFGNCSSLTSVTIPISVTSMGYVVFQCCSGLTSIKVESGNPVYNSRNNCNAIIKTQTNELVVGCRNTTILNSVSSIGDNAFDGCIGLTSVAIPNSVTSIGDCAFAGCSGLTSVVIPNSVTHLGGLAFHGCSLTSITIPKSVISIGSVSCISDSPFTDCKELTTIKVESGNPIYDSRNDCNAIIETQTNKLMAGCKKTIIPNSILSIGKGAFFDCKGLTSIFVPNSVTSIGASAFDGCSSLTSFTIPNSVKSIGGGAFWGCSGLTSVTIPNSVTSIEGSAFRSCSSLTSITIPNSVTSIGIYAFDGCRSLTSFTIPNSVKSIGNYAFEGCNSLTSVISEIETPFAFGENAFNKIASNCTLTVPAGTKNAYIAAGWTEDVFKGGIIESSPTIPANNALYPTETTVFVGESENMSIHLDNEDQIIMFEFYMQLPEGLHVNLDADGYYDATLNGDRKDRTHFLEVDKGADGLYHFLCYSNKNKPFLGNEGELLTVNIGCDEGVAGGTYQGVMTNVLLSDIGMNSIELQDVTFDIEVVDYILGDLSGDKKINGMDIVRMVSLIMGQGYMPAADLYPVGNPDGVINGMDLVLEVQLVMSQSATQNAPAISATMERQLTLAEDWAGTKTLGIDAHEQFILAQMTVEVSEGMTLDDVTCDRHHTATFRQLDGNRYAVVCYSNRNAAFESNASALTFHYTGSGELTVSDVMLVGADEQEYRGTVKQDMATGINEIVNGKSSNSKCYDLQGRQIESSKFKVQSSKLKKGVYIINGQKTVVK